MGKKVIFVALFISFLANSGMVSKGLESNERIALNFFINKVINKYPYFNKSTIKFNPELVDLDYPLTYCVPCDSIDDEGRDHFVQLDSSNLKLDDKSKTISNNEKINDLQLTIGDGERIVKVNVSRKYKLMSGLDLVVINCKRINAPKKISNFHLHVFLNESGKVVNWCVNVGTRHSTNTRSYSK